MAISLNITVFFFLISASALAQQPVPSDHLAVLQRELAAYKNGSWLYARSDAFRHIMEARVEQRIGLATSQTDGTTSDERPFNVEADSTLDISRTGSEEDEPTVAISRTNPRLILAGMNDNAQFGAGLGMSVIVSTNAGNSWKKYHLPKVNDNGCRAYCDPVLISDDAGMFYYGFLIINTSNSLSDIMVGRSTDGVNWVLGQPVVGNVTPPGPLEDKPAMAVDRDPNSPYHGRLYLAWSRYTSFANDSLFDGIAFITHSDDHGDHWSPAVRFSNSYGSIATVRIGKGGVVFVSSSNYLNDTAVSCGMAISHDGGTSFTELPVAKYQRNYPVDHNIYVLSMLKGTHGFRSGPDITFDLDPSNNHLYAVYGNYDTVHKAAQQFAVESSDEGRTWTLPRQIGTPSLLSVDHFIPWVTFDPGANKPYVSMYSSEEDPLNNDSSRYVRCSFDALDRMEKIGSHLFDPRATTAGGGASGLAFIGDYTYSDAFGGTFAAVWTENRPPSYHDGDIFAYVSSPTTTSVTRQINRPEFIVGNVNPNPGVTDLANLSITSGEAGVALIRVFDLNGREVLHVQKALSPNAQTSIPLNTKQLSAGVYHVVIEGGQAVVEKNFVVLR